LVTKLLLPITNKEVRVIALKKRQMRQKSLPLACNLP
jgi:hypothetical protein